ncbi:hypothetical protein [Tropicibacter oceani]|uniref:Uncharacterized protein n=1 Tax=Tropicibacter oceani TaxID=3058420 RepID=A0ABY8QJJ3_9RHOB|nr:hypothetical protein [Tropicibacter oceani]WGW04785.1 hypothetical protein QF118_04330 [Tropicibacter oceani]
MATPVTSQEAARFPPIPAWQPSFAPPLEDVIERFRHYSNGESDFVVFRHSTCCIVPNGLSAAEAESSATEILEKVINFHPDFTLYEMDDGNVLVGYRHPAFNIVLTQFAQEHWREIENRHLDGLVSHEILITPLGQNVFDDRGKMALLGRSYLFMDALSPVVDRIERAH